MHPTMAIRLMADLLLFHTKWITIGRKLSADVGLIVHNAPNKRVDTARFPLFNRAHVRR